MVMPVSTFTRRRVNCPLFTGLALLVFFFNSIQTAQAFTLTCPQNYTIQLPPGSCGVQANFDTLTWSSSLPLVSHFFFPPSGTFLETGITTVFLGATDINGTYSFCSFEVTVVANNTMNFTCPPSVQLSLNGLCERNVNASDILGQNVTVCANDYMVQRIPPNGGFPVLAVIDANDFGQSITIRVTNLETLATCETQATVVGGAPPSITCPPNVIVFCNQPVDSSFTGVPALTGCYDEVGLSFEDDLVMVLCPDSFAFQIVRTWVAVDPFGKEDACEQFITGMRYNILGVEFPPDFDGTEQQPLVCNDSLSWEQLASTAITGVPLFNNQPANGGTSCRVASSYIDYETQLCGASYRIERVWSVVKLCAPSLTVQDTQIIIILDTLAPVFEVPDTIFISLSSDCSDSLALPSPAILHECSGVNLTIETPWDTLYGENMLFFHPAAGSYPALYKLTDQCGNTSEQPTVLLLENHPRVICPPDDTITCNYYQDTLFFALIQNDSTILSRHGNPVYPGNCSFELTETDTFVVSNCGIGFVQRRITNSSAENPVTCIQNITVLHVSDFEVQFPADTSVCGLPNASVTGQPFIFGGDCENLTIMPTDQIIPSGQTGCYTVLRTWKVTNTCIFNGTTNIPDPETGNRRFRDGGDGYITYLQTIEVNNQASPIFPSGCELPDLYLGAASCSVPVTLIPPAVVGCGNNISLFASGSLGTITGSTTILGTGTYSVNWKTTDACGNMQTCSTTFEVLDTLTPLAVCKNQLTVNLLSNGQAQVFAVDFDNGSTDNCGSNNLNFSFSTNPADISRTFQCCMDEGLQVLTLWVTDAAGNQRSCQTSVLVQSATNSCNCNATISGNIKTETGAGINKVKVSISSASGFQTQTYTNFSGAYSATVPVGEIFLATPYKDTLPLNGVTTFDAVLMTRHILGSEPLNSPYKIIAADVNKSGSVTTLDAVDMRRLILGIITKFPNNNTSWRFVDADFIFPNPANPFAVNFPASQNINPATSSSGHDFIGIKVGDLNNSADPGLLATGPADRSFRGSYPFLIKNTSFEAGITLEVPVFASQNEIHGFQMALGFDIERLELMDVRPGFVDASCFGKNQTNEGLLKLSWVSLKPFQPSIGQPAFTLVFLPKTKGKLSEQLYLEPTIMAAEVYSPTLEFLQPQLIFEDESLPNPSKFRLLGHRPNPFSQSTAVSFYLPEAGNVRLTIFNPSGQVVHLQEQFFEMGGHEIYINGTTLPGNGLYFYRLESARGTAESRLIKN